MTVRWSLKIVQTSGYLLCLVLAGLILFSSLSQPVPEEQFLRGHGGSSVQKSSGICDDSILGGDHKTVGEMALSPLGFSILDWNIYKGSRKGWEEDLLRLGSGKDIIFLQEASLALEFRQALDQSGIYWHLNNGFYYWGNATGVLLASLRSPLASCGQRTVEPLIGVSKTVLLARYSIEGTDEELLVANIHAINITLGIGSYQDQFTQLETILSKHKGPLLVVGDFNNWNDGRSTVVDEFTASLNLLGIDFKEGGRTRFFGDAVDQVYYRGLIPVRHEVYQVGSSDHNPIAVTFRLANSVAEKMR